MAETKPTPSPTIPQGQRNQAAADRFFDRYSENPPFISQDELLHVARLRSHIHALENDLDSLQRDILQRLRVGGRIEEGPFTCRNDNMRLRLIGNDQYHGSNWYRESVDSVLG